MFKRKKKEEIRFDVYYNDDKILVKGPEDQMEMMLCVILASESIMVNHDDGSLVEKKIAGAKLVDGVIVVQELKEIRVLH